MSTGAVALRTALQRLLVVAAAVALLGHGGVQVGPRLIAAGASASAAVGSGAPFVGRVAAPRPVAESQPVERAAQVRTSLLTAAPAGSADTVAGPGASPLVAPHLVARPVARPPTPSHVRGVEGGASGRAPPAPAGT